MQRHILSPLTVHRAFFLIVFCLCFSQSLSAASFQAEDDASSPRLAAFSRPDPEGVPTKVSIGSYLMDLAGVDDVDQTFSADFFLWYAWHDPRLALKDAGDTGEPRIFSYQQIWHPFIEIFNQRDLKARYDEMLRVDAAGNVQFIQRYTGELSTPLQHKDFPFDSQELEILIGSMRYGPDELSLVVDEQRTGRREWLSITGWSVGPGTAEITTEYLTVQDRHLARMDFRIPVKRHASFFYIKVIIPLCLIVLMAWFVLWIDPSALGPQIGIPTSAVFALILYIHRTATLLPRIDYLTRLDRFILGTLILVFVTLGEAVTTTMLTMKGKKELALSIDRHARYVYFLLFLLIVLQAFVF